MGIAVVTSSASLPAAAGTLPAAGTDAGTGGDNFAALLFGQIFGLAGGAAEAGGKTPGIATAAKEDDLRSEDGAALGDGSQLLATLGLITPEVVRPTPAGNSASDASAAAGSALGGAATNAAGQQALTQALADADARTAKFAAAGSDALRAEQALAAANDTSLPGSAGPAHAAAHPTAATAASNAQALTLATPVRDAAWGADFAQKVVWLASSDKQSAQLTLNPPQMGPIEISLNLSKDSASAVFVSPNAEVRNAIESALPKLREMLAGVGIELGQANVSSESFRQQSAPDEGRSGATRWQGDAAILPADTRGSTRVAGQASGLGLVDTFA